MIDREIVVLDATGRPSCDLLQNYPSHQYSLVLYLFEKRTPGGSSQPTEKNFRAPGGRVSPGETGQFHSPISTKGAQKYGDASASCSPVTALLICFRIVWRRASRNASALESPPLRLL